MATVKQLTALLEKAGVAIPKQANKGELQRLCEALGNVDEAYVTPMGPEVEEELYEPYFGAFVQHKTDGTYGRFYGVSPGRWSLYNVFGTDDAPNNGFVSGREEREVELKTLKPADEHHMALMHMRQTIVETWHKDRSAQHKPNESGPEWAFDALV